MYDWYKDVSDACAGMAHLVSLLRAAGIDSIGNNCCELKRSDPCPNEKQILYLRGVKRHKVWHP